MVFPLILLLIGQKTLGLTRDHSLRNKIRHQTNVEKNGVDYQKKKYEKYKKTMEKIYGRENFFSGEEGSSAVKDALVEKYGVENAANIDGILEKRSETFHGNISSLTNKEREELSKARAERAKKRHMKNKLKNLDVTLLNTIGLNSLLTFCRQKKNLKNTLPKMVM